MKNRIKWKCLFLLLYVAIIISILLTIYEISELQTDSFYYIFFIISISAIIILIFALHLSQTYLTNIIPSESGVLLQRPSMLIPLIIKKEIIPYKNIEYIFLDETLMLSWNNQHPSVVIDILTIVEKNKKKHKVVVESSFKERESNMQYVRSILRQIYEISMGSGKEIPIFVKYNLGSDPKIMPDGEKRRGMLDMDMEIEPDFYFHLIENRITYKGGSALNVGDFRIQDVPHIVLHKYETPEEKIREIRMRK